MAGFAHLNGAYFLVKTKSFLYSPSPISTPSPASPSILAFPSTTIGADGDVYPSTAPIQRNGNVYTFTRNLNGPLVVKRDNIMIDGSGHSLMGNGTAGELFIRVSQTGIDLTGKANVTIKNLKIYSYKNGIYLDNSPYTTISGNSITQNGNGVFETASAFVTISENNIIQNNVGIFVTATSLNNIIVNNNIVANLGDGITLSQTVGNVISSNNISYNGNGFSGISIGYGSNNLVAGNVLHSDFYGIYMTGPTGSIIAGNNITKCSFGITGTDVSGNVFYMNNFNNTWINNFHGEGGNSWDNGTIGNYWSDYATRYPDAKEIDSSGIGNTPYVMVEYGIGGSTVPSTNNIDYYPLMAPVSSASASALVQALVAAHSWSQNPNPTPIPSSSPSTGLPSWLNLILFTFAATGIIVFSIVAVAVFKRRKKSSLNHTSDNTFQQFNN